MLKDGPVGCLSGRTVETGAPFKYIWQLRNRSKTNWPTALLLRKMNALQLGEPKQFVITSREKKLVTGPIVSEATVQLVVSGITAPKLAGWHHERWSLSCAQSEKVLIHDLPLLYVYCFTWLLNVVLTYFRPSIHVENRSIRPHTSQGFSRSDLPYHYSGPPRLQRRMTR